MNKNELTLGSLFSGSGGFELAGILAGVKPVFNCEVEPFPIRVTTKRFPDVKHYGDVSVLNGCDLEPVDIITFGSPCQDMSIAGKRAGLDGSRSNLFYEAIRIVREMREKTNGEKPRYIIWENVPGAFSSNNGEDFRKVLEEIIRIKEPDAEVPAPGKDGWPYADTYLGDGWSVAYRTLDAQHFGVPQRRRRIYLVGDFAGGRAPEILFVSDGLSGYSPQSVHTWQRTAGDFKESPGEAGIGFDRYNGDLTGDVAQSLTASAGSSGDNTPMVFQETVLNDQGGQRMDITEGVTNTLRAEAHHPPVVLDDEVKAAGFCTEHSAKSRSIGYEEEISPTLRAGIVPAALALQHNPSDSRIKIEEDGNVQTLCSRMGTGGNNVPLLMEDEVTPKTLKIRCGAPNGGKGPLIQDNLSATLATNNDQTLFVPFVKGARPHSAQEAPDWKEGDVANTLNTFDIGETRCNELAVEKKPQACSWDGGQISPTLTKDNADGTQHMPDKDNFNCVLDPVEPEQTAFGISSYQSHAMLSENPHAGIYEAKTSRTLDGRCNDPSCNQGGVCVVEKEPTAFHVNTRRELVDLHGKSGALMASQSDQMQTFVIQGSMIGRDDKNGPQGDGVNEDVSFTLNTVDRHAVAAPEDGVYAMTTGSYMEVQKEKSPTLMARDYKDPTTVAPVPSYGVGRDALNQGKNAQFIPSAYEELQPTMVANGPGAVAKGEPVYTVRRLTPTECARLQGFPDWWTDNLGTENPTDEEIAFWTDVFETHRKVVTHASKPKTEKQIRKWLADPYSDNAAYRMWGNGICLNCALYVLSGIVWAEGKEE